MSWRQRGRVSVGWVPVWEWVGKEGEGTCQCESKQPVCGPLYLARPGHSARSEPKAFSKHHDRCALCAVVEQAVWVPDATR